MLVLCNIVIILGSLYWSCLAPGIQNKTGIHKSFSNVFLFSYLSVLNCVFFPISRDILTGISGLRASKC